MDGRGGKVNSVESVTGIPATDGSKSQVTDMNLCSLSENDFRGQDIKVVVYWQTVQSESS